MRDQERVDVGKGIKKGERKKEKQVWILIRCMVCTRTKISVLVKAIKKGRLFDSTVSMQGAQDGYLVKELDLTGHK